MSSLATPATSPQAIPDSIRDQLRQLRGKLGRFVLVFGLSRVLAATTVIVLLDLALDRIFKMDLAQRGIMLVAMLIVILAVCVWKLLWPLTRHVSDDALILQIEDRNRQLQESLISSVQFSRNRLQMEHQGYSLALVDATIGQGKQLAKDLDFTNTINHRAAMSNLAWLVVSLVALGGISWGVANTDFWRTWLNRNVLLTNDQWPRDTQLAIAGVIDGQLVLPRGEDHKQLVEVLPESRVRDVEVSIEFEDGSMRTRQPMRPTGNLNGREHQIVFRNVANEFRFRAVGGDDTTSWVDVRLVDPPGWSELQLTVRPPSYTGVEGEVLPPGGGPWSVLAGSSLELNAVSNKPLNTARLTTTDRQWSFSTTGDNCYALVIPANELSGGKYTFDLVDSSGLGASRPAAFTIKIKPDRPPQVRATLPGTSGLVVPRARIPVEWTATDDFAITRAGFIYEWTGDSADSVPQKGAVDLPLVSPDDDSADTTISLRSVNVLDVEPLAIPAGVSLHLAVSATDNNTRTGPGIGESRRFLVRVVTEDELRSDLLRREIDQRKAFELALKNQEELQVEVRGLADSLGAETDRDQMDQDLLAWQRRQKMTGTNIATVADRFENFLIEVKNNRLDEVESEPDPSRSLAVRFNDRIIFPIRELDQSAIIEATQLLDQSRRLIDEPEHLSTSLAATADKQDEIIATMQTILAAMQDSETYQEVVNLAIEIKRRQEKVREMTRDQKSRPDTGDLFNDTTDDELFNDASDDDDDSGSTDGEPPDGGPGADGG